jgi:uncharacterized membrane protein YdbT with pleckstrin-like domain
MGTWDSEEGPMNYVQSNLLTGESTIYQARLSKAVFFWPAVFLIVGIGTIWFSFGLAPLCIIISIVTGINALVSYRTAEFAVTNKRVIIKVGWIPTRSLDLALEHVEGIVVQQGLGGKILGYGTVVVTGTGGSKEVFSFLPNPLEFRKQVQNQTVGIRAQK